MNEQLLQRLLYQGESATLDFKVSQYPFAKATELEKSELLKDILGFANAWRNSDAYILVGVKDVQGGPGIAVGINPADHLDDHSIQQFVNNITNKPVRFHYEAFGYHGMQLGVFQIGRQDRPIYLKKNFGKLSRGEVYVRRGSSTDPTSPASPDEIAQMGLNQDAATANIDVGIARAESEMIFKDRMELDVVFARMPPLKEIPSWPLPKPRHLSSVLQSHAFLDPKRVPNSDFLRQLADFECKRQMFVPIRLAVANVGQTAADNVRAEVLIGLDGNIDILKESEFPERPQAIVNVIGNSILGQFDGLTPYFAGELCITKRGSNCRIELDFGKLQPGRTMFSEAFLVGGRQSTEFVLNTSIFADNLPTPKHVELNVMLSVLERQMDVEELIALAQAEGDAK